MTDTLIIHEGKREKENLGIRGTTLISHNIQTSGQPVSIVKRQFTLSSILISGGRRRGGISAGFVRGLTRGLASRGACAGFNWGL